MGDNESLTFESLREVLRNEDPSIGFKESETKRLRVAIRGAVQGVGFRPYVYRLARRMGLRGWVLNSTRGVFIEAEGSEPTLRQFLIAIQAERPPLAIIQSLEHSFLDPVGLSDFCIRESDGEGEKTVLVLPDIATCDACLRESWDPSDRRYRYPFTNCTQCGPRFTIIESLPYDRPLTSMKSFPMCEDCAREYSDPGDRRFHAQPVACARCGPHIWLTNGSGKILATLDAALKAAARSVESGRILALKGLGGFHLIVDARNPEAVSRLRLRKRREEKPLALMYPTAESVVVDCEVSDMEMRLLTAPERPIVLLRKKPGAHVAENVAPNNPYLGCMLPYTPLHYLLTRELGFPIVATSGNLTDEPIARDNDDAFSRLSSIADLFLFHNRDIVRRVDDSIARVVGKRELVLRRARGYAPLPIMVKSELPQVLALGGHLKNSVAFSKGRQIFVTQHLGDLDNKLSYDAFVQAIGDLQRLYEYTPEAAAVDLHPAYLSTRYGESLDLPLHRVQHHMAHVAACVAENELDPPVLGVAWDGTGFGLDGTTWGGEFLLWNSSRFEWSAAFKDFPLLGGEKAVREPRRVALALLHQVYGNEVMKMGFLPTVRSIEPTEKEWFMRMLETGASSPRCRSVGRIFDGISSLLGLRQHITFEGQAAMAVEHISGTGTAEPFSYAVHDSGRPGMLISWEPIIEDVVEDLRSGKSTAEVALRFHVTLAEIVTEIADKVGEKQVALSGGVFQNALLSELVLNRLTENRYKPYFHQRVPPNDGCISLGQIVIAAEAERNG